MKDLESSEYQSRASSFSSVAKIMALHVRADYGGERFATFLLRNVTYRSVGRVSQGFWGTREQRENIVGNKGT